MNKKLMSVLLTATMVLAAFTPVGVSAQESTPTLTVTVTQDTAGEVSVAVTDNGTAVGNATVNVTADAVYDGNGTYETTMNGTVDLPRPDENLTVTVTATNGSDGATVTAELALVENAGFASFGQWVSSFVAQLQTEGYFGAEFGQKVSEFATENNPGAGEKPEHAGPKTDDDEAAGAADAAERRGPPEHAKANGKHADDENDEAETDVEEESTEEIDCSDGGTDGESCEDETSDGGDGAVQGDDEDGDDAPGNSGGNKGQGNGNGNGRGK